MTGKKGLEGRVLNHAAPPPLGMDSGSGAEMTGERGWGRVVQKHGGGIAFGGRSHACIKRGNRNP